jgi:hypothetical protein
MEDANTFTKCPFCGKRIDKSDPDVRYGVPIDEKRTLAAVEFVTGPGGWFHPECSMWAMGYEEREPP